MNITKALLDKVMKGEATVEENQLFLEYLRQKDQPADLDEVLPLEEWQKAPDEDLPAGLREKVFTHALGNNNTSVLPLNNQQPKRMWMRWMTGVAALFTLAIAGIVWYRTATPSVPQRHWISYATQKGEVTSIRLPDSSIVHLNADSRIEYEVSFSGEQRLVKLIGEAEFDVTQHAGKPFVVLSDSIQTTVLGTTFNVRAYPKETLLVTVHKGKVKVSPAIAGKEHQAVILEQGQFSAYNRTSRLLEKHMVDIDALSDWKNDKLVFEDANLLDICTALERRYNITIHIQSKTLLQSTFSITFSQLALEEALEKLTLVGGIEWKREGNTISLMENP